MTLLYLFPFIPCESGAQSRHFGFFISVFECLIQLKRWETLPFISTLAVVVVLCWSIRLLGSFFPSLSTKVVLFISKNAVCTVSRMVWIFVVKILSADCFPCAVGKIHHSNTWEIAFKKQRSNKMWGEINIFHIHMWCNDFSMKEI